MLKAHPNQYVYFNETIGGIKGAYGVYETEYWCNSNKQAVEWFVKNVPIGDEPITVATNFETYTSQYYFNKYTDKVKMLWRRENERYKAKWDYAFFGTRTMSKEAIENCLPPKGTIHTIEADGVPLVFIVKRPHLYLAESYEARQKGDHQRALELAQKAVEEEPNNLENLHGLALCQMTFAQNEAASATLNKCLELNSDDYSAHTLQAVSYYNQKKYELCISEARKSVERKINNVGGYQQMAKAYAEQKKYTESFKNFELALKYANYQNASIFFDAGLVQLKQGMETPEIKTERMKAAIMSFERSLKLQPNPQAYQNIAYAYSQLGDMKQAEKYLQMAQGKKPQ
jgi:Tfp pilus assembly protein PilF